MARISAAEDDGSVEKDERAFTEVKGAARKLSAGFYFSGTLSRNLSIVWQITKSPLTCST